MKLTWIIILIGLLVLAFAYQAKWASVKEEKKEKAFISAHNCELVSISVAKVNTYWCDSFMYESRY